MPSLVRGGKSLADASPIKCKAKGDIHIANRVEKFSTTTAVSRSFKGQSNGPFPRGKNRSVYQLAVGALGVTAAIASLHTSAQVSMAAGCEPLKLDFVKGDWREVKGESGFI